MRVRSSPVDALGTLLRVTDDAQRRASFRQAIAALGHRAGLGLQGAPPLDGMDQDVIQRALGLALEVGLDRKSTRLNSSHSQISYAVFCLKKKKKEKE